MAFTIVPWSSGYADRYLSMDPTSILLETPGNFEIINNGLIELVVRYNAGGEEDPSYYDVIFGSSRGDQYQMEDRSRSVEALVRSYPSKPKAHMDFPKMSPFHSELNYLLMRCRLPCDIHPTQ